MKKLIIIGGGASGLMAAGFATKKGYDVTIVEHSNSLGKKLLITGKGRCNVTNNTDEETLLKNIRKNSRFMFSSINGFNAQDTMNFFEKLNIPLKTERGRRVFPTSDKAQDILNALFNHSKDAKIVYGEAVEVLTKDGAVTGVLLQSGEKLFADKVVLATGGLSYPKTGSTGDGYKMARALGHTIIQPTASLVPLIEKGRTCVKLMGLSLKNINLKLKENDKVIFNEQGELLFTHFGLSGPLVLSASANIRDINKYSYKAIIDFKPALTEEELDKRLLKDFEIFKNKNVENALDKLLPQKSIPVFLERWGVASDKKINSITKKERLKLVELFKNFEIEIDKLDRIDHAVITSGGISVKEINPKTMESKLIENLYFIGEIIDVDAYTGGYNLQIAFATAYAMAKYLD